MSSPGHNGPPSDADATIPVHSPVRPPASVPSGPGLRMPDSWDARLTASGPRPLAPPPPPPRRMSRSLWILGGLAVGITTGAAAAVAWRLSSPDETAPATAPPPSAATSTRAAASSAPTAPPAISASASAPAPPVPPPKDAGQCFAALLEEGAFGDTVPNLDHCCKSPRAYQGMLQLKSAIVRAGGTDVTPAMIEWSKLGWYETATYAVMRAHCCPDAAALTVPQMFAECRIEEALAYVVNGLDDDAKMRDALDHFNAAAKCISSRGWAGGFGQTGSPYGGERIYFDRIYSRVKQARGR